MRSPTPVPSPSRKATPPWQEWLAALAASLVLTTVMTWPTLPHLGSFGRLDTGDGRFSIWNVGWVDHALLTDPRHLLDANIFWPHQGTLAYSEMNLVAGLLGLPVFLLTHSALAAENAAVLTALLLCLMLTWRLVRRLTGSNGAGFVSAELFTFCSFIWGHTAHVQLLMSFVLPLVLLAFHRLDERPSLGRAVGLGAALTAASLACGYYGIYGGVFLAFVALGVGRWTRRYWIALGEAAAIAALLLLPFVVPFERARAATGVEPVRNLAGLQISANLQDYLTAPTVLENALFPWHWRTFPHESLSPGLVLLVLVVLGIVPVAMARARRRRETPPAETPLGTLADARIIWAYCLATALAVWASLGPSYGLYAVLMHVVPGMQFVRAPSRMGITVALGLAVIGGFGARRLTAGRPLILAVLVSVCLVDRFAFWPGLEAEPIPRVYRVLATLPAGAVVDFPFPYTPDDFHRHTRAMYYSTADWKPRVNGYSDIVPADFAEIAVPINAFPELAAFPLLHRYQVRYVVWEVEGYARDPVTYDRLSQRFRAAAPYLRPIAKDHEFWLYEIVGWPPETAPSGAPSGS